MNDTIAEVTTKEEATHGLGMPYSLYLQEFGAAVRDAFGEMPYHVGSSLSKRVFNDVDVRLILDDADFKTMFGCDKVSHLNAKWVATTKAWSAFGTKLVGFNVDFQIQPRTEANSPHNKGPRSALGMTPASMRGCDEYCNNCKHASHPKPNPCVNEDGFRCSKLGISVNGNFKCGDFEKSCRGGSRV